MSGISLIAVQRGFESRLDGLARAMVPPRPVAWENVNFQPPADGRWWQTSFQPGQPIGVGLGEGGTKHYYGIFQVNAYQNKTGGRGGPAFANEDAVAILGRFPIGSTFIYNALNIHILSGGRGTGDIDQNWYYIPVRISWQTWVDEEG